MHGQLKLALGFALSLGLTSASFAADLAVKSQPVVAPIKYAWTGCYLGGNAGGGWTKLDTTRISQDTIGAAFADYGSETDTGFLGGGQFGCDFQTTNLVFGLEGEFEFGNIKGSHPITSFPTFTERNNLRQLYLLTGRIGYLWTPQFLGYVKMGVAAINNRNTVTQPNGAFSESATFTDPGIAAGIGAEWMLTPNWSIFAEWSYVWTEDDSAHDLRAAPGLVPPGEVINFRQRVQSALIGVNYKFHWDDGPVVAKY